MITTYFLNCLMGNAFGTQTVPPLPEKYYIGLSLTEPTSDGTGVTEPSDDAYERIELTSLSMPNNGTISNIDDILFPAAVEDWGHVSHYAVFDSLTDGNLLLANSFFDSSHVDVGRAVRIKAGTLEFTLKNINEIA